MNKTERHSLLFICLFFILSFSACSNEGRDLYQPSKELTYVIVHGAWGGSWAFREVDSILTFRGHNVYRPSLTGLGERVHLSSPSNDLSTHIKDVINHILYEDLHDIILVGHSYGGMVISGVADSLPERIQKLVYLEALVPENGENVLDVFGEKKAAWAKAMVQDGYMVPPWLTNNLLLVGKDNIPGDVPQSYKTFTEPILLKNQTGNGLPAKYILTVEEGGKAEEDDFALSAKRAKDKGWTYYEMTADHNPQWSAPEALVDLLTQVSITDY
ncbi:MAG: alpha/beta fold hydrolase [Cytophagaceae bacterium]